MQNKSSASLRAERRDGGKLNETAFLSDANRGSVVEAHSWLGRNHLPPHRLRKNGEKAGGTSLRTVQGVSRNEFGRPDRPHYQHVRIPNSALRVPASFVVERRSETQPRCPKRGHSCRERLSCAGREGSSFHAGFRPSKDCRSSRKARPRKARANSRSAPRPIWHRA